MKSSVTVLRNGIRLLLIQKECVDLGVTVALAAGKRFEAPGEKGLTHLVEHMIASETKHHPTYRSLGEAIDAKTLHFEAYLSETAVTFTVLSRTRDLTHNLQLLAGIVCHPRFRRDTLIQQQAVIAVEQQLNSDDPAQFADDLLRDAIFRGSDLADGSTPPTERSIEDVTAFYRRMVCGSRMVIAVVGEFDVPAIVRCVRRYFGRLRIGAPAAYGRFDSRQRRRRLLLCLRPYQAAYISIGFPTFGFTDPDRVELSVLSNHLGGTSRWSPQLYQRLSVERGLVYGVSTHVWHFPDTGWFAIETASNPDTAIDVLRLISEELRAARTMGISADRLTLAKSVIKKEATERRFRPTTESAFYAVQYLSTDRIVSDRAYIEAVDAVTVAGIRRVARRVFLDTKLSAVIVGSIRRSLDRKRALAALKIRP